MSRGLVCVECGREADAGARGWEAHLVDSDAGGADELAVYCPACSDREFRREGDAPHR